MARARFKLRLDAVRAQRITHGLSGATLAAILFVWGVTRWQAEEWWWTTLLLYLPQVGYAIPVVPLALIAARQRVRRALLLNGVSLAVIAGPMMGFNLPSPQPDLPRGAARVRVLAYNILGGKADFAGIRRQVAHHRPDVVVLSEAHHYRNEERLKTELARMFPGWHHVQGGDVYVASRWPLVARQTARLGPRTGDPSTERFIVHAEVEAPFGRFHVVGVHFRTAAYGQTLFKNWRRVDRYMRHTGRTREEQVAAVRRFVDGLEGPLLLCGDFNTPPTGRVYSRLTRKLKDSFREAGIGWGYTYPASFPILRIDYVFHSVHWTVISAESGSGQGSDHCPVLAELALPDVR